MFKLDLISAKSSFCISYRRKGAAPPGNKESGLIVLGQIWKDNVDKIDYLFVDYTYPLI